MSHLQRLSDWQIIHEGLKLILRNLDKSDYDWQVKHQMLCRINRILAGIVSDNNPESKILDGNIYTMGLEMLIADPDISISIRQRAEEMLDES